ncbi:MAG: HAD family hydrolase [Lachnospiraceae bacterium]|nr:HAD family hydrolase [Lachnospiraceae bacterium]
MKKGIIFDLDGTLWDSCEAIAASWNEYVAKYAQDVQRTFTGETMRALCGLTMTEFGDALFGDLDEKRRYALTDACCEYEVEYLSVPREGVFIVEGLRPVLEELKKEYPLYIVSNCQKGYIEDFLINSKMGDLFEDLECFGDTGQKKSFNIRLLKNRNHLDEAIYVGDTQGDYDSAVEAGVLFVHAAYGYGTIDRDVPAAANISELPQAIEAVVNGDDSL